LNDTRAYIVTKIWYGLKDTSSAEEVLMKKQ